MPGQTFQASTRNRRQPGIVRIGNDAEKLLDLWYANRRDDAKLGHVGANGVDHHGALANQQVPRAVQHQHTLLLRTFHRYKTHGWSCDRLTDGCRVRCIVLATLDIGLHIMGRHQFDLMAKPGQFAAPSDVTSRRPPCRPNRAAAS